MSDAGFVQCTTTLARVDMNVRASTIHPDQYRCTHQNPTFYAPLPFVAHRLFLLPLHLGALSPRSFQILHRSAPGLSPPSFPYLNHICACITNQNFYLKFTKMNNTNE